MFLGKNWKWGSATPTPTGGSLVPWKTHTRVRECMRTEKTRGAMWHIYGDSVTWLMEDAQHNVDGHIVLSILLPEWGTWPPTVVLTCL